MLRGIPLPEGVWHTLVIKVHGFRPNYDQADLAVTVNGRLLKLQTTGDKEFTFDLGALDGPGRMEIHVASTTFVPSELGMNGDTRALGIDIDSLLVR
jgi:hypothetical protein